MDASAFDVPTDGDVTVAELVQKLPDDVKRLIDVSRRMTKLLGLILSWTVLVIAFGHMLAWVCLFWLLTQLVLTLGFVMGVAYEEPRVSNRDSDSSSHRPGSSDERDGEYKEDRSRSTNSQSSRARVTQASSFDHSAEDLDLFEEMLNSPQMSRQVSIALNQPQPITPTPTPLDQQCVPPDLLNGIGSQNNEGPKDFEGDDGSACQNSNNIVHSEQYEPRNGSQGHFGELPNQWDINSPAMEPLTISKPPTTARPAVPVLSQQKHRPQRQVVSQTTWLEDMKRGGATVSEPRQGHGASNWANPQHFRPTSNREDLAEAKTPATRDGYTKEQLAEAVNFAQMATRGHSSGKTTGRPSNVTRKGFAPIGPSKQPPMHPRQPMATASSTKQPPMHLKHLMATASPLSVQRSSSPPRTLPPHLRKARAANSTAQDTEKVVDAKNDNLHADRQLNTEISSVNEWSDEGDKSTTTENIVDGRLPESQREIGHKHFGSMTSLTTTPDITNLAHSLTGLRDDEVDNMSSQSYTWVDSDFVKVNGTVGAAKPGGDKPGGNASNTWPDTAPLSFDSSKYTMIKDLRDLNTWPCPRYNGISSSNVHELRCTICKRWAWTHGHDTGDTSSICLPCYIVGPDRIAIAKGIIAGTARKMTPRLSISRSTERDDYLVDEVPEYAQSKLAFTDDSEAESTCSEDHSKHSIDACIKSTSKPARMISTTKAEPSSLVPTAPSFVVPVASMQRSISHGTTGPPELTRYSTLVSATSSPLQSHVSPAMSTHTAYYPASSWQGHNSSQAAASSSLPPLYYQPSAPTSMSRHNQPSSISSIWTSLPDSVRHEITMLGAPSALSMSNGTNFDQYLSQYNTNALNPSLMPFVSQQTSTMPPISQLMSQSQKASKALPIVKPQKPDFESMLSANPTPAYEETIPALPAPAIRTPPGLNGRDGMRPHFFDAKLMESMKLADRAPPPNPSVKTTAEDHTDVNGNPASNTIKYEIEELKKYAAGLKVAKENQAASQADAPSSSATLRQNDVTHVPGGTRADGVLDQRFLFGGLATPNGEENSNHARQCAKIAVRSDSPVGVQIPTMKAAAQAVPQNHASDSSTTKGVGTDLALKKRKKAARAVLKDTWKMREDIRVRLIGTWTLDGARALEETTTNYMSQRSELMSCMASGELNEDDTKVFPPLGKTDLSAPKHRP